MKRFRGTVIALVLMVAAVVTWMQFKPPVQVLSEPETPDLFQFEKENLSAVVIKRPDTTIELRKVEGVWTAPGYPWNPSRTMVRRVGHQLHDLKARATVTLQQMDPARYGFGDDAIEVTLEFDDGAQKTFQVGDPNPTSVSFYIRPMPGDSVFIVKKSAVDYYRLPIDAFRERKFATFSSGDVKSIRAVIDGRTIEFQRTGEKSWDMIQPLKQAVDREHIRAIFGGVGSLKAMTFEEDEPKDLAIYGLARPYAKVELLQETGQHLMIEVGDPIEGTDPSQRYMRRVDEGSQASVYRARDRFLDDFQREPMDYRKRRILNVRDWDILELHATREEQTVVIVRTSDGWRWADGAPIPGSTPRRVTSRLADLHAVGFHDEGVDEKQLAPLLGDFSLVIKDREQAIKLQIAGLVEDEGGDRHLVVIEGEQVVYEIDASVGSVIEDLFREHRRKMERDEEKNLDAAQAGTEVTP